jgi:hypothetical protein
MKTFISDKPVLRYLFLFIGLIIGSFTGCTAAIILLGVIFKWIN